MARQSCQSIYDLAEQTGVSVSTVSRVLNRRGRISDDTRRRVLKAARKAGFRPRVTARNTVLAVVMDRFSYVTFGGFIACLLTHLLDELSRHRVTVEVFTEHNFDTLSDRFVDGVLAMTWDDDTVARLQELEGVPVVMLNRLDIPGFSGVATDHNAGGRMVAEYLLGKGHERIAFLAEEQDWGAMHRLAGYSEALEERGLALDEELVAYSRHRPLAGLLPKLIAARPTALFLAGEDLALESCYILREVLGVRIPEDISVVGLENSKVSQFLTPPNTTLAQPLDKLAAEALRMLLELTGSPGPSAPRHELIPNDLIERDSVKALNSPSPRTTEASTTAS